MACTRAGICGGAFEPIFHPRPPLMSQIRNPQALCSISHIACGGEHPPNSTVMGMTEGEVLPGRVWEGRRGAEAALASRGGALERQASFF